MPRGSSTAALSGPLRSTSDPPIRRGRCSPGSVRATRSTPTCATLLETVVDFDEAGRMKYERLAGERRPTAPGEASFWVARTESSTATDLTWAVDDGDWTVVVMNADGTPG